jgi:hypothetical protein
MNELRISLLAALCLASALLLRASMEAYVFRIVLLPVTNAVNASAAAAAAAAVWVSVSICVFARMKKCQFAIPGRRLVVVHGTVCLCTERLMRRTLHLLPAGPSRLDSKALGRVKFGFACQGYDAIAASLSLLGASEYGCCLALHC